MQMQTMTKKVTKSGAVTLPRGIRQATGLLPGVPVDVEADGEGIRISKHVPACSLCGSVEEVAWVMGMEICGRCAGLIGEVFDGDGRRKAAE